MTTDRDKAYLLNIRDEILRIEIFIEGVSEEEFINGEITETKYAVVRCLEIIGEAANRLSTELKKTQKDISWVDIIGTRNKLIHEYLDVNYKIVWDTIQNDLPLLKNQIDSILS